VPPASTASATSGALVSFGDLFLDNACFYAFVTAPISTISACNRVPPSGALRTNFVKIEDLNKVYLKSYASPFGVRRFDRIPLVPPAARAIETSENLWFPKFQRNFEALRINFVY